MKMLRQAALGVRVQTDIRFGHIMDPEHERESAKKFCSEHRDELLQYTYDRTKKEYAGCLEYARDNYGNDPIAILNCERAKGAHEQSDADYKEILDAQAQCCLKEWADGHWFYWSECRAK